MAGRRAPRVDGLRREVVRTPDEVAAVLRPRALGWGTRRIAAEFGRSRDTVARHVGPGGWAPPRVARRPRAPDGLEGWLAERFRRHRGNADVVRQELPAEHGIAVSLRTVGRAAARLRREPAAEARATGRFETPPGHQVRIDFGGAGVVIGGEVARVFLFVATLGRSRRTFVRAFRRERQAARLDGRRLPPLRRVAGRGPARQRARPGHAPRRADPRGGVQRAAARLRALLGRAAGRLRAAPGADQGQEPALRRTSAGSATSSATPWPAAGSRAGRRWRRTSPGGRARSPTSASTARRASRRSRASGATRRRPRGRSTAGRRSGGCATPAGGCCRTAPSRSTRTPAACPGG